MDAVEKRPGKLELGLGETLLEEFGVPVQRCGGDTIRNATSVAAAASTRRVRKFFI
jgi:hypothetical protein